MKKKSPPREKSSRHPSKSSDGPKQGAKQGGTSKVRVDDRFAKVFTDPEFSKTYKRDTRTGELITDHSLYNVEDYVELDFSLKADTGKDPRKDIRKDAGKDTGKDPRKDIRKDAGKDTGKDIKKNTKKETKKNNKKENHKHDIGKRPALAVNEATAENAVIGENAVTGESGAEQNAVAQDDGEFRWQAESTSSSESDSEDETMAVIRQVKEKLASDAWGETEENIPTGDTSSRLAIMGCDWNTVAASDLFVLCHSSVEGAKTHHDEGASRSLRSDKITRVSVYLSDFGAEKLEHERTHGPSFEELELIERRNAELKNNDGEVSEATALAIRKYDRQRSRYYYAVVECVDVKTAEELYDQLDGMDADFTVDGIDLRYIPDDLTEFPRPPESICDALPYNYIPPVTFASNLKHTHAELHWDDPDPRRHQLLTKRYTEEEMNAMDLEQYLASTDSSDQEDQEERIKQVRKLLLGNTHTTQPDVDDSAMEGTFFISASGGNPVKVDSDSAKVGSDSGDDERATSADKHKKRDGRKRSGFALLNQQDEATEDSDDNIGDILLDHVSDGKDSDSDGESKRRKGKKSIRQRRKEALVKHRQKKHDRDSTDYVESMVKNDDRFGALFNDPAHFV